MLEMVYVGNNFEMMVTDCLQQKHLEEKRNMIHNIFEIRPSGKKIPLPSLFLVVFTCNRKMNSMILTLLFTRTASKNNEK